MNQHQVQTMLAPILEQYMFLLEGMKKIGVLA